jgi:uncharacterized phage protein (TIGR02218 family)
VSPGALSAMLRTNTNIASIDLYTVTLLGGAVLRWTSGDRPVTINGATWVLGPGLKRGATTSTIGVDVDTVDMKIAAGSAVTVNGVALMAFISRGGMDNARVAMSRAFYAPLAAAPTGMLPWFSGRVSEVSVTRMGADLRLSSDMELLNVSLPREVWQPSCLNTLYDSACGISRASLKISKSASSATNAAKNSFQADLGAISVNPEARFDMGTVTFTSGANSGLSRTVKSSVTVSGLVHQIVTLNPLPFAVAIGDTFDAYPGCDKTVGTCEASFSNVVRFRGMPYVPAPETVL